jgi:hypothetical protein
LWVAVVDNCVHEPEHLRVLDAASDQVLQDLVVDGRKKPADVRFQDVTVPPGELVATVHRGVGALAFAAGVAVVDE